MVRTSIAVIACVALVVLTAPTAAMADQSERRRLCPSASAGPTAGDSSHTPPVYRSLETRNLSCRKGERIMDAFARRFGWPPVDGSFTGRIDGFRCKSRFGTTQDGGRFLTDGTVACRKGTRRVEWIGSGLGLPNSGGPD